MDSVLAVTTQALDALAEGYERAQRDAVRREVAARREFIGDLLYGRSYLGSLAHAHVVVVARGTADHDEGDPVQRAVGHALTARFGEREPRQTEAIVPSATWTNR